MKNWFKKKQISTDLIEISRMHVGTGQIGHYLKKLCEEEGFMHMGYRYSNHSSLSRFVIYAASPTAEMIQYFKDRCPAMVENECRALEGIPHDWVTWPDGFREIVFPK